MCCKEFQDVAHDRATAHRKTITQFFQDLHTARCKEIKVAARPGTGDVVAGHGVGRGKINDHDSLAQGFSADRRKLIEAPGDEVERPLEKFALGVQYAEREVCRLGYK